MLHARNGTEPGRKREAGWRGAGISGVHGELSPEVRDSHTITVRLSNAVVGCVSEMEPYQRPFGFSERIILPNSGTRRFSTKLFSLGLNVQGHSAATRR